MNLFISILLIIISVGIFFTYIDGEYQEILEKKKIKQGYVDQEFKTNQIIKERRELITQYEKIDPEVITKGLNKLLPDYVDNVELVVDIERIIKGEGIPIRIDDISLTTVDNTNNKDQEGKIEFEENKNYNNIIVGFSFVTKYEIFKRFMVTIKESLRVFDVVSVNFSPQSDSAGKAGDNFKFDIQLRTYWLKK